MLRQPIKNNGLPAHQNVLTIEHIPKFVVERIMFAMHCRALRDWVYTSDRTRHFSEMRSAVDRFSEVFDRHLGGNMHPMHVCWQRLGLH